MIDHSQALALYLERIRLNYPNLDFTYARINPEGLANVVIIINDELVFRFPKTDSDREQLAYEAELLATLRGYISLPIPVIEDLNKDFAIHRYLPGSPLYRHNLLRCTTTAQDGYARELAKFLRELHMVPLDDLPNPPLLPHMVTPDRRRYFLNQLPAIQDSLYPLLWSDQRAWMDDLFAPVIDGSLELDAFEPALTHRDLAAYHILHDPQREQLSGIIDFGIAVPSDPAEDLGMVISHYGESILRKMARHYPFDQKLVDRARFYAAYLEIEWALRGVQSQNLDWLVVTIGRARDSLPIFTAWD